MKRIFNLPSILLILTIVFVYATKSKDIALADSLVIFCLSALTALKLWFDFKTPFSLDKSPELLAKEAELRKLNAERELVKTRLDISRLSKAEKHESKLESFIPGF